MLHMCVCMFGLMHVSFSNLIVSTNEWKTLLAAYIIDYDLLDIKEIIASGLWNWMYYYQINCKHNLRHK